MSANLDKQAHSVVGSRTEEAAANGANFIRKAHRWVAMLFTLLVAANFAAMIDGPPPAWLTYSPLLPLLALVLTGLPMLVQHHVRAGRRKAESDRKIR